MNPSSSASPQAVASHRPYLYKYALSRVWHKAAAEDIVQETLLAALEGWPAFRGDCALRTWLTGILKHKIVDWHRREAGNAMRSSHTGSADAVADIDDGTDVLFDAEGRWIKPPSEWPDPGQCFENHKFWETFAGCLARLPRTMARAFFLREVQGLNTAEICAELGISESNCWVLLHRARMSLRRELEDRWFGGEASPRTVAPSGRTRKGRVTHDASPTLSSFALAAPTL